MRSSGTIKILRARSSCSANATAPDMGYLFRGILIGLLFGVPAGAVGAMTAQRAYSSGLRAGLLTGLQMFGESSIEQAEGIVRQYSDITDTYLLAMPSVSVNGVDYTANAISEPERFHILEERTCTAENEIVLTEFVASDLGVDIGDTVTVRGDLSSGEYTVSGIYSCANNMGANVGLSQSGYLKIGRDDPRIWCWHYFLGDPSQKAAITQALEERFGGDVHVHENTWPGLYGIIAAMRALVAAMYIITAVFILVVTVLTGSFCQG